MLLIGHRKLGETADGTLRRIGQAFRLAVITASLGLTGMVFSGFPGVAQLGVFAVVGVLCAAAATRFILPRLIVAADLAPVSSGDPAGLLRVEHLRRFRWWGAAPILAAALGLLAVGGPRWEGDIANLSPVPQAARDLDARLRQELGVPEPGQVLVVQAPTRMPCCSGRRPCSPRSSACARPAEITGFQGRVPSAAERSGPGRAPGRLA